MYSFYMERVSLHPLYDLKYWMKKDHLLICIVSKKHLEIFWEKEEDNEKNKKCFVDIWTFFHMVN